MCITGVSVIEFILASGMSTFLPKYIANQFAQPASWAAQLTGKSNLSNLSVIIVVILFTTNSIPTTTT